MNKTTCPICDGEGKSHDLDDLDCGRCCGTGAVDIECMDEDEILSADFGTTPTATCPRCGAEVEALDRAGGDR